jgi:hypothetical protein
MRSTDLFPVLLVAAAACGGVAEDEPRTMCRDRWIGSPDSAPAIAVIGLRDGAPVEVGDAIDREALPEGGDGLRLSIRGQHLHACAIAVAVRLRGPDGEVRAGGFVELEDRGDGWGIPAWDSDLAYLALPAGPGAHELSVIVEDATGRTAAVRSALTVR